MSSRENLKSKASKPEKPKKTESDLKPDPEILSNRYGKKLKKYLGSKETELHAGYKNSKDPFEDTGEDRAEKRAVKEVLQEAGIKFMSKGGLVKSGKPKLAKKGWK